MAEPNKNSFLDRALRNLRAGWDRIAGAHEIGVMFELSPDLGSKDVERLVEQMAACLEGRGGEVSARSRAAALGRAYLSLNASGRKRFLTVLAEEFGVDSDAVDKAVEGLHSADNDYARQTAQRALRTVLDAPRLKLLTQFNVLPEGVKFLVDLRTELSPLACEDLRLAGLDADLKTLLTSWFDIGFLELRRITWGASAALLEKLIAYEAVHAIQSWDDLKNRLAPDRRCFAYFHPRMPDEPLIFVWVALVSGISDNIQALLDESAPLGDPESADTAIFYSISNAQRGLNGINFGNFLIKRVVDSLSNELKGLKTFATLSPVPGFRTWLDEALAADEAGLLRANEHEAIKEVAPTGLRGLLGMPGWIDDPGCAAAACDPLLRLCAYYLTEEKSSSGTALNSVAHFHLFNGARIEKLNWRADLSERGIDQSAGIMVNFLYELDQIDANHEAYSGSGEVCMSAAVGGLL